MPRRGGGGRRSYGGSSSGGGSSFSFWPFSTSSSTSSSSKSKKGPFSWRPASSSSSNDQPPSPATSPRSAFVEGASLGSGMRIGDRIADAVVGPRVIRLESSTVASTPKSSTTTTPTVVNGGGDACDVHNVAFQDCLNNCESEISKCQIYMNMLAECRKNSSSSGAAAVTVLS